MRARHSEIITISVPPEVARAYKSIARGKGESASALFREMFKEYQKEQLENGLQKMQAYGSSRARDKGITEKDIERLVFGGR
jgi:hypothetical protein